MTSVAHESYGAAKDDNVQGAQKGKSNAKAMEEAAGKGIKDARESASQVIFACWQ